MKDVEGREDVELLVNEFYNKVRKDEVIGFIFNDVAKLDWNSHLPRMYDFWESILFGAKAFKGNPMMKHIELNKKITLEASHFDRWKELWSKTVHDNFSGEMSEEAKARASSIAALMLFKVEQSN